MDNPTVDDTDDEVGNGPPRTVLEVDHISVPSLVTSCVAFRALGRPSSSFGVNACVSTDSDERDSAHKQRAVLRERLQRRRTRLFVMFVIDFEVLRN